MINSQIPYNKLPFLSVRSEGLELESMSFMKDAIRAMDYLNGFLDGFDDELYQDYLRNLQFSEIRHSLELEGFPVALNRIFEADNSENALQDEMLSAIIDYHNRVRQLRQLQLDTLKPASYRQVLKNADQFRERKEHSIKSYFTNLTLYTAPVQSSVVLSLRQDLDNYLSNKNNFKTIEAASLLHYQLRAVAPFNHFNGVVARTLHLQCLKLYGLDINYLPISIQILRRKETYQTLMRDSIQKGELTDWHRFMALIVTEAAKDLPKQLKNLNKLKRQLIEQIDKYTDYSMPSDLGVLIMKHPYIKVIDVVAALQCHRQTAATYLRHLVKMGILIEKSSGREKLYLNKELLDILAN
jgi:Fic family protein